jgi:hypothetical protein
MAAAEQSSLVPHNPDSSSPPNERKVTVAISGGAPLPDPKEGLP